MGNIFNRKRVWKEELLTIKSEIATLDKQKCKMLDHEKTAKRVCMGISIAALIIAIVLVILTFYFEALGLVCAAVFFYGCHICMSKIFKHFVQCNEDKLVKYHASKNRIVNEIKNQATYNEAKSLLAGHDPEIDQANAAYLNLEPITY